ncbi:hypothetical protein [Saccharothrix deserti]|uniref:hypothetical protein n=1 Tax=Saccharothrix deserti TaxID=2593674 RepID=UPI00131B17A4|nr:hypothetical protein [Saccharothrix deserti]
MIATTAEAAAAIGEWFVTASPDEIRAEPDKQRDQLEQRWAAAGTRPTFDPPKGWKAT